MHNATILYSSQLRDALFPDLLCCVTVAGLEGGGKNKNERK